MSVQVLSGKLDGKDQEQVWLDACNASFATMIKDKQSREAEEAKATVHPSPLLLHFYHRVVPPCIITSSRSRAPSLRRALVGPVRPIRSLCRCHAARTYTSNLLHSPCHMSLPPLEFTESTKTKLQPRYV